MYAHVEIIDTGSLYDTRDQDNGGDNVAEGGALKRAGRVRGGDGIFRFV